MKKRDGKTAPFEVKPLFKESKRVEADNEKHEARRENLRPACQKRVDGTGLRIHLRQLPQNPFHIAPAGL